VVLGRGSRPAGIATVQLDGDPRSDLAVTDSASAQVVLLASIPFPVPGIVVAIFAPPVFCDVGRSPQGLSTADFNGDSIDDLAVANRKSNSVSILLGDGIGASCPPTTEIFP